MVDAIAIRDFGMSGLVLMENAGRGCAERLLRHGINGRVLICCGAGNNGGDGFVIARHLANAGIDVRVLMSADPSNLSPDAHANYGILAKTRAPIEHLAGVSPEILRDRFAAAEGGPIAWIVDALLGTGATGPIRAPLDAWIRLINASAAKKLAIDIPSGLDCDSGQPGDPCIEATETCTFVSLKPCFLIEPGKVLAGKVSVIDIGVPKEILIAVERLQRESGSIDFGRA
jgi:NAD(P)H-hydrate epimerase